MAVIIPSQKIVLLHPMKTGGTWMRAYLRELGIPFYLSYPKLEDGGFEKTVCNKFNTYHLAVVPEEFKHFTVISVTRPLVAWYRSFWLHTRNLVYCDDALGSRPFEIGMDKNFCDTFELFINNIARKYRRFGTNYFMAFKQRSNMTRPLMWVAHEIYRKNGNIGTQPEMLPARNIAKEFYNLTDRDIAILSEYDPSPLEDATDPSYNIWHELH